MNDVTPTTDPNRFGSKKPDAETLPLLMVYYDGSCPLCTVEIGHYAARCDQRDVCFIDVSEPDADIGNGLTRDVALARFHVRLADGRLLSGAQAFSEVWHQVPSWRWMARLASLPGVMSVLEIGYRLFLPVRPLFSRLARQFGARSALKNS